MRLGFRLGLCLTLALVVIWTHPVPATRLEGPSASGAALLDPVPAAPVTLGDGQAPPDQSLADPVVLTVRVLDRNQKPVTDLRQEDFVVVEDRVQQRIERFSVLALEPGEVPAQAGPPPLVTAATDPLKPQDHRLFVFFIGTGKLETGSKGITALRSFVETHLLPQDRVAVFAYGRALDFTSDCKLINEVLERVRRQHEVDFNLSLEMGETGMAPLYGTRALSRGLQTKMERMLYGEGRTPQKLTAEAIGHEEFGAISPDDFLASTAVTARDEGNLITTLEYLRHFEGKKELLFLTEKGLLWPAEETDRALSRLANEGRVSIHSLQLGGTFGAGATLQMTRSFGNLRNMADLTGGWPPSSPTPAGRSRS